MSSFHPKQTSRCLDRQEDNVRDTALGTGISRGHTAGRGEGGAPLRPSLLTGSRGGSYLKVQVKVTGCGCSGEAARSAATMFTRLKLAPCEARAATAIRFCGCIIISSASAQRQSAAPHFCPFKEKASRQRQLSSVVRGQAAILSHGCSVAAATDGRCDLLDWSSFQSQHSKIAGLQHPKEDAAEAGMRCMQLPPPEVIIGKVHGMGLTELLLFSIPSKTSQKALLVASSRCKPVTLTAAWLMRRIFQGCTSETSTKRCGSEKQSATCAQKAPPDVRTSEIACQGQFLPCCLFRE